jgi:hypothetical protein
MKDESSFHDVLRGLVWEAGTATFRRGSTQLADFIEFATKEGVVLMYSYDGDDSIVVRAISWRK